MILFCSRLIIHNHSLCKPKVTIIANRFFASSLPLTDKEYHNLADSTLNKVFDLIDNDFIESNLSQGVLKFDIDSKSWVLNKQSPNKQIWWSSPISGPLRFEYNRTDSIENAQSIEFKGLLSNWKCTKDGSTLYDRLRNEILDVTKYDLSK